MEMFEYSMCITGDGDPLKWPSGNQWLKIRVSYKIACTKGSQSVKKKICTFMHRKSMEEYVLG